MSKVSLNVFLQELAAVESCVCSIENAFGYSDSNEEVEELRENWDRLYSTALDLHENTQDFIGEIEH